MARSQGLGELQLAILKRLWARGEATVADVHSDLEATRPVSASTVGTMLQKMERRGLVAHESEGRRYLYRAEVSEAEVRRSLVGDLLERLFGGDPKALVGHLVREEELEGSDLDALQQEIEAAAHRERARREREGDR